MKARYDIKNRAILKDSLLRGIYLLIDQKALLFEQMIFVLQPFCCLLILSQLTTQVCELAHFTFFLLGC